MMDGRSLGNNGSASLSEHGMRWSVPVALATFAFACVGVIAPGREAAATSGARVTCGKRASTRWAPEVRREVSIIGRGLPPDVIQGVVRESFGRFRRCYEAGLRDCPSLQGRVVVEFVIRPDGTVARAKDGGSDMVERSIVQCVVKSFESLRFPAFEGAPIRVVYPIAFEPGR